MDFAFSFIILSQLLLTLIERSLSEVCTQQSACSCKTTKYTLDFSSLGKGANPRFPNIQDPKDQNTKYDYQPCIASTKACGHGSSDVAICQNQALAFFYNVGNASSAQISGDADQGTLQIAYKGDGDSQRMTRPTRGLKRTAKTQLPLEHPHSLIRVFTDRMYLLYGAIYAKQMVLSWLMGIQVYSRLLVTLVLLKVLSWAGSFAFRHSIVHLKCGSQEKCRSTTGEEPKNQYNFELTSPLFCPPGSGPTEKSGLSTGSVLLIIFFVLLLVYFITGAVFLKFRRGAQGVEIIPNLEFWKALPGLIKDGTLFVFRGCKTDTSYSQI